MPVKSITSLNDKRAQKRRIRLTIMNKCLRRSEDVSPVYNENANRTRKKTLKFLQIIPILNSIN